MQYQEKKENRGLEDHTIVWFPVIGKFATKIDIIRIDPLMCVMGMK